MKTVSRDELYEQVWTMPLRDVAKSYGLSDVGIAKICKRLAVPRPPQGHWARVQRGHDVVRPPLPPLAPGTPSRFEVPDEARVDKTRTSSPARVHVVVAEKLKNPHPMVRKLLGLLVKDFRLQCMRVVKHPGQATLRVSEEHEDRAARILDALCRWLTDNGHPVDIAELPSDRRRHVLLVGRGETSFRISLIERLKQVDHVLTAKEKADQARYSYMRTPKTDFVPTGKFILGFLQLGEWATAFGTWKDGRLTLEEQLGDALARIPGIYLEVQEAKRARAEAARRERADAVVREQEARHERHTEELIDDLGEMTEDWHHARRIREFLAAAEPVLDTPGAPTGRRAWLDWARSYADSIDPIRNPGSIAKVLTPSD